MSTLAEEQYWKQFEEEKQLDKKRLVVGATVYRARYEDIEQGTVFRVTQGKLVSDCREILEDPNGPDTLYVAKFGTGNYAKYESQSYQWKWFSDIKRARRELIRQLRERAEKFRKDSLKCDSLADTFEKQNESQAPLVTASAVSETGRRGGLDAN